jgi:hypothetical protein
LPKETRPCFLQGQVSGAALWFLIYGLWFLVSGLWFTVSNDKKPYQLKKRFNSREEKSATNLEHVSPRYRTLQKAVKTGQTIEKYEFH